MILASLFIACLTPQVEPPTARERAVHGMEAARDWLLANQEDNGAWGHWRKPEPGAEFWSTPETHYAFQAATTALGCMSMLDYLDFLGATQQSNQKVEDALTKGLDFLITKANVKRPNNWDTDHTWALSYGMVALAQASTHPHFQSSQQATRLAKMQSAGEELIARLGKYQTASGGWAYYADESMAARPHWATSFQTAVVVLGLLDARELGWNVSEARLMRAINAVRKTRLPNGAYAYSVQLYPNVGGLASINQIKGSLGRIQVCNLALFQAAEAGLWNDDLNLGEEQLEQGLRFFFKDHKFLDAAAGRPIPHESWYSNSGYFYFFGHYYAAGVVRQLSNELRGEFAPRLWRETLKYQAKDGSLLDFKMNSQGRPYATAYALSALAQTIPPAQPEVGQD